MVKIKSLKISPEDINDIAILAGALSTLEELRQEKEIKYVYIQLPQDKGPYRLIEVNNIQYLDIDKPNPKVYDEQFFRSRIQELNQKDA